MNPELTQLSTPSNFSGGYPLKIPKGSIEIFASNIQNIPESAKRTFLVHTVRRGETISRIANKYGISKNDLADANNISTKSKLYSGVQLKIPVLTNINVVIFLIIRILKLPKIILQTIIMMVMFHLMQV